MNGNNPVPPYGHYPQRPPSDDGDEDENDTIEEEDEEDEDGSTHAEQHQGYYQHQCRSLSPGRSISQNRTRALRYRKAFMGKW